MSAKRDALRARMPPVGSIVLLNDKPRLVIGNGRYIIQFEKIGWSWTSDRGNPTANYDVEIVAKLRMLFEPTPKLIRRALWLRARQARRVVR